MFFVTYTYCIHTIQIFLLVLILSIKVILTLDFKYIVPYLQNKISNPTIADALKQDIERRYYHYGNHFKSPFENNNFKFKESLKINLRRLLVDLKSRLFILSMPQDSIISNAYVSAGQTVNSSKFNFVRPPWSSSMSNKIYGDLSLIQLCERFKQTLNNAALIEFLSNDFLEEANTLYQMLENYYNNPKIVAGLFPYDIGFFECISIDILKKLKKPSVVYLHGIPGVYEQDLYTRGEHLFVYGNQIKENFKLVEYPQSNIHVVGYPIEINCTNNLKNSFDNILVLGMSMPGSHFSDRTPELYDRGHLIYFPYIIQDVLQGLGVKSATFRPHPSERIEWYLQHIDSNFYKVDSGERITTAISKSTLVIGPTSSVALEAIALGVNFICFEPFDIYRKWLVPPYDGTDTDLVTCFSPDELRFNLINKKTSNQNLVRKYLDDSFSLDNKLYEILNLKSQ